MPKVNFFNPDVDFNPALTTEIEGLFESTSESIIEPKQPELQTEIEDDTTKKNESFPGADNTIPEEVVHEPDNSHLSNEVPEKTEEKTPAESFSEIIDSKIKTEDEKIIAKEDSDKNSIPEAPLDHTSSIDGTKFTNEDIQAEVATQVPAIKFEVSSQSTPINYVQESISDAKKESILLLSNKPEEEGDALKQDNDVTERIEENSVESQSSKIEETENLNGNDLTESVTTVNLDKLSTESTLDSHSQTKESESTVEISKDSNQSNDIPLPVTEIVPTEYESSTDSNQSVDTISSTEIKQLSDATIEPEVIIKTDQQETEKYTKDHLEKEDHILKRMNRKNESIIFFGDILFFN